VKCGVVLFARLLVSLNANPCSTHCTTLHYYCTTVVLPAALHFFRLLPGPLPCLDSPSTLLSPPPPPPLLHTRSLLHLYSSFILRPSLIILHGNFHHHSFWCRPSTSLYPASSLLLLVASPVPAIPQLHLQQLLYYYSYLFLALLLVQALHVHYSRSRTNSTLRTP
jgi:hypothetical protein